VDTPPVVNCVRCTSVYGPIVCKDRSLAVKGECYICEDVFSCTRHDKAIDVRALKIFEGLELFYKRKDSGDEGKLLIKNTLTSVYERIRKEDANGRYSVS